ncbi:hypothetical protein HG531_001127 [Fusarium graminearum]|nr:hypothetical protein HG531_001127 [Fusarium graminearum]
MADTYGMNGHNGHVKDRRSSSMNGRNRLYAQQEPQRTTHLSEFGKHMVAASGEFVGTFLFLYFGYAGNIVAVLQEPISGPNGTLANNTVMYIAMAYGFSLLVNVWTFYRISGGLFNPAVTFGLCLSGQLPWIRALFLFPSQIIAAMCAGGLVNAMFPGSASIANTTLGPNTSTAQGVFLEMFFTAQLVFVVLMLAAEKSRDTFLAPVGIGLALFVALIPGVFVTGGSANPVRSFGCAVGSRDFPGYHWIYWVGPLLGAALAAGYFRLVKMMHYEEANPGQDSPVDVREEPHAGPPQDTTALEIVDVCVVMDVDGDSCGEEIGVEVHVAPVKVRSIFVTQETGDRVLGFRNLVGDTSETSRFNLKLSGSLGDMSLVVEIDNITIILFENGRDGDGLEVLVDLVAELTSPRAPDLLLCPDLAKETLITIEVVTLDSLTSLVTFLYTAEVSTHVSNRSDKGSTVDVPGANIDHAHLRVLVRVWSVKILTKRALRKISAMEIRARLGSGPAPLLSRHHDGLLHGHLGATGPFLLQACIGLGIEVVIVLAQAIFVAGLETDGPVKVVENTADLCKMRTTLPPVDDDGRGVSKGNCRDHSFAQVDTRGVGGEEDDEATVGE